MLQRLFDNAALDLVKVILNLHGARVKRRKRLVIQRFAFSCFGIGDVVKAEVWMVVFGRRRVLDLQIIQLDNLSDSQGDGAFEDVLEFAEVAGIAVMQQGFLRFGAEFVGLRTVAVFVEQVQNQRPQVFTHFAQGRHVQGNDVEAVI